MRNPEDSYYNESTHQEITSSQLEKIKAMGGKLYRNFYRCEGNHEEREQHSPYDWEMVWDCSCNDKCPQCWVEMEPWKSVSVANATQGEVEP